MTDDNSARVLAQICATLGFSLPPTDPHFPTLVETYKRTHVAYQEQANHLFKELNDLREATMLDEQDLAKITPDRLRQWIQILVDARERADRQAVAGRLLAQFVNTPAGERSQAWFANLQHLAKNVDVTPVLEDERAAIAIAEAARVKLSAALRQGGIHRTGNGFSFPALVEFYTHLITLWRAARDEVIALKAEFKLGSNFDEATTPTTRPKMTTPSSDDNQLNGMLESILRQLHSATTRPSADPAIIALHGIALVLADTRRILGLPLAAWTEDPHRTQPARPSNLTAPDAIADQPGNASATSTGGLRIDPPRPVVRDRIAGTATMKTPPQVDHTSGHVRGRRNADESISLTFARGPNHNSSLLLRSCDEADLITVLLSLRLLEAPGQRIWRFSNHINTQTTDRGSLTQDRAQQRVYRIFGCEDAPVLHAIQALLDPTPDLPKLTTHYQEKFPEMLIELIVRDPNDEAAQRYLASLDTKLREKLGHALYGVGNETLSERVGRRLIETNTTIATAESCTGGMLSELLTRGPGSSQTFLGGVIVYSNREKVRQLGVRIKTLDAHGAVSQETAVEMALGALERFNTELAVAISGVAGPDGGTPTKPVGTVWLCLASRLGPGAPTVATRKLMQPGTRDQIRTISAWWALAMIDAALPSQDPAEIARAHWILNTPVDSSALHDLRTKVPHHA